MGLFLPGTSEKALPNIVHPWYKQLSGQLPAHFLKLAEWQQTERCDRPAKAACQCVFYVLHARYAARANCQKTEECTTKTEQRKDHVAGK